MPGPVLDGAGDAGGDVELRRHGLAGLADLVGVRVPARVHGGPGGADRAAAARRPAPRPRLKSPPVPRPPETTTAASVSSGRPLACLGSRATIRAPLAASEMVTASLSTPALRRRRLRGDGVRLHRDHRGALGDRGGDRPVAGEHRLGGRAVGGDVGGVGDQAGAELDRQPTGDLLALGGRGDQHRGRADRRRDLGQRLGLGRDQVLLDGRVGHRQHPGRPRTRRPCSPPPRRRRRTRRPPGRPAGGPGSAARRVGLVTAPSDQLGDDQDLRHVDPASRVARTQMYLPAARNSTSAADPAPSSSGTTWPASLGGRGSVGDHLAPGGRQADRAGVDPQVGQRPGLDRLLLGGQDALHRRVAGLAGLVGHADHGRAAWPRRSGSRCRRPAGSVTVSPLTADARPPGWRPASPAARRSCSAARPCCRRWTPCRRAPGRARPCGSPRRGSRWCRGRRSRATASSLMWMPAVAPICSDRLIASAASSGPSVMATTSTSVTVLGDPQGLLHRVLVELGQQPVGGLPVDGAVGGEAALTGRVGNVLDQDDDLHLALLCSGTALYYSPVTCASFRPSGCQSARC